MTPSELLEELERLAKLCGDVRFDPPEVLAGWGMQRLVLRGTIGSKETEVAQVMLSTIWQGGREDRERQAHQVDVANYLTALSPDTVLTLIALARRGLG